MTEVPGTLRSSNDNNKKAKKARHHKVPLLSLK